MSRLSVTTTTNNKNPPRPPASAARHQARHQAGPGSEEWQQQKRLRPIIVATRHLPHAPQRPSSQAERARRPGLDQALPIPSALFPPPCLLFLLIPAAAALHTLYQTLCSIPSLTLLLSTIPRTAPCCSSLAALRLLTPCSLPGSGSSSDPSRFGCPKRDPITTAPSSPTSPASSTTSGLSSACFVSRPHTLYTRLFYHQTSAYSPTASPQHTLPTCPPAATALASHHA